MKKEAIDKILDIGVSNDELRYWMNKPFTIGKYSYSTDARIIIRVPRNLSSDFNELEEKRIDGVLRIFNNENEILSTFSVSNLEEAVKKVPLIDEYSNCDETGDCKECDGDGEVEWEYESYTKYFDCPVCDGDGTLTESKRNKTGRKIKASYFFDFDGCIFSLANVENLINISNIAGVKNIESSTLKGHHTGFFKVGIIEVVIGCMSEFEKSEIIKIHKVK